ncbi:pentapeptide repeat family protein [Geomicrobium sp. JCM 19037]|uniref:pentapeptide repeat-containing protein n=1 Tax=unclassified Geomicrobium TaxID=2628951 RepID=UPI00045F410A|nr:pentapeptide repeat-containing protein [Geomicrobium sp. JCM 19037]GAK03434.1 pentapeptide repeat family protein [Geomicrobium sp. JCM 19037]
MKKALQAPKMRGRRELFQQAISPEELYENIEIVEQSYDECDAKHVRFSNAYFKGVSFFSSQFTHSEWVDCVFEKCDLSNVDFANAIFHRTEFMNCKMSGATLSDMGIQDTRFVNTHMPYVSLSFSTCKRVRFEEGCALSSADIVEATFQSVELGDSTIEDVQFSNTNLGGVDFSDCQFERLTVSEGQLAGCTVSETQAIAFIRAFGIHVKGYE